MSNLLRLNNVLGFLVGCLAAQVAYAGSQPVPLKKSSLVTSGYIDVQYRLGRGTTDLNGVTFKSGEGTTFLVNKGTMMLSDSFDGGQMVLDIPFQQNPNTASNTSYLELGTNEAQAFLSLNLFSNSTAKFGQFDSPFGTEGNDTTDIAFPRHGIMRAFVAKTHTGVLYDWHPSDFSLKAIVANSRGSGLQSNNASAEFGVIGSWVLSSVKLSVGGLYNRINGNYQLSATDEQPYQARILLHTKAEYRRDSLTLNAEANLARSGMPKAFVQNQIKTHSLVQGFLIQGLYQVNETWDVGLRYEFLANDETNEFASDLSSATTTATGQDGFLSRMSFTVRNQISRQLTAKAGFDLNSEKPGTELGGKTQGFMTGAASLLYSF